MKYLLKQNKEDKGILCDKVTIDGFDYYLDYSQPIKVDKQYISNQAPRLCVKIKEGKYPYIHLNNKGEEIADFHTWKGVIICSNNPNIDIPQVVDDIEGLAIEYLNDNYGYVWDKEDIDNFKYAYNKSQEMFLFTEEDMIEFAEWCQNQYFYSTVEKKWSTEFKIYDGVLYTTKELLKIWKEQRTKIVYYESN